MNQEITTFNNKYEVLDKIGDGLTAIVYLARRLDDAT